MSSAILSADGVYRYTLHRDIPSVLRWVKPCLFILLNPSKADASIDDPTSRRGAGFAADWGCTSMTFVNWFGLRSTDPGVLSSHPDPTGPDNVRHVLAQIELHRQIGIIVAAWGAHPIVRSRGSWHIAAALAAANTQCLGVNKDGSPKHPLYIAKTQPLMPWKAAA